MAGQEAWAAGFDGSCWLQNEEGEEKVKEREDGSVYIKGGKYYYIAIGIPIEGNLRFNQELRPTQKLRPIPRNPRLGKNRRSEKLASRENESCVFRKDKKAWVI